MNTPWMTSLTTDDIRRMRQDPATGPVCWLDVRTLEEYVYNGHIPGATLIPLDELEERAHAELNPNTPIVTLCEHGVRSAHAASTLTQLGFRHVSNYADGMADWDGPRAFAFPANRPLNRTIADGLALSPL